MKGHEGKVALVTGAAQGIGRAYSARLAAEGVDVACVDLKASGETVAAVEAAGRKGVSYECDISSPEGVTAMAERVLADFGQLDILVNNAGIYPVKNFDETTWEDWRRLMSVNLDAIFLLCQAFVPGMRERGWGRVVNQASNLVHR